MTSPILPQDAALKTASEKQYAHRDVMELDLHGGHYCRHVSAMTGEGLHSKSAIAAELAWRDSEIARLSQPAAPLTGYDQGLLIKGAKLLDTLASGTGWEDDARRCAEMIRRAAGGS